MSEEPGNELNQASSQLAETVPGAETSSASEALSFTTLDIEQNPLDGTNAYTVEMLHELLNSKVGPAAFGNIVTLLLRSPNHKHYSLMDLEWLVGPPLSLNQFALTEAKLPDGRKLPAAVVFWAQVSEEVDAWLSAKPRYPIRLHFNEWKSGEIIWVIDIVGDERVIPGMMKQLSKTVFRGKKVKVVTAVAENKVTVK